MGGALASLAAISVKSNIPWAAVRLFTFGACVFFYSLGEKALQYLRNAQANRALATRRSQISLSQ